MHMKSQRNHGNGVREVKGLPKPDFRKRFPPAIADLFEPLVGGNQPDLFAHLTAEERQDIMSCGVRRSLVTGTQLYTEGVEVEHSYVIQSGLIRAHHVAPSGREITLAYWRPGSFVGNPDVFKSSSHIWTGIAMGPTDVIGFSGNDLRRLMEKHPRWAIGVIEALAYKVRCFSALVKVLGTRSIRDRICQILLALCDQYGVPEDGGGIRIDADFTHEDMAHMVGSSRQWVTTTLDRFQAQGLVRLRRQSVIVLRPELLMGSDEHA